MAVGRDHQNKKINFLQWLFLIIIPLILAISIAFIILSILNLSPGAKIKEIANQVPVINQFVTTEEEAEIERRENRLQSQITTLESDKTNLEADLAAKEAELDQLTQEITKLTHQLEQAQEESGNQDTENLEAGLSKVIDTYQKMTAKNAAQILATMSDTDAILILTELDETQRAAILSSLDPETAAKLTKLLLN